MGLSGKLSVRNIRLIPEAENSLTKWLEYILLTGWGSLKKTPDMFSVPLMNGYSRKSMLKSATFEECE